LTVSSAVQDRTARGCVSYHAGRAAELTVSRNYLRRGFALAHERWRGRSGEIDLIMRDEVGIVFVEVKKSRSFEQAAQRLTPRQMQRIRNSAEEYVGHGPHGSLTHMRFDVALVDHSGEVQILENAF